MAHNCFAKENSETTARASKQARATFTFLAISLQLKFFLIFGWWQTHYKKITSIGSTNNNQERASSILKNK